MKSVKTALTSLGFAAFTLFTGNAFSQALPYGAPINLETAKKAAQGAATEMRKVKQDMIIAVVDSGGNLVYLERSDQAGLGTIEPAIGKAKAASNVTRTQGAQRLLQTFGASGVPALVVTNGDHHRLLSSDALFGKFENQMALVKE